MLENGSFEWVHDRGEENYATDGSLDVGDSHDNGLPIPFDAVGEARLQLIGPNDFSFTAKGTRVTLVIAGPPTDRQPARR
jgi:hypothetical protein